MKTTLLWCMTAVALNSTLLAQSLVINEFMADNQSTVIDITDNNFEDWVEIYNGGGAALTLNGYYLTDDAGTPGMWPFPTVTIPAGGFLLVWTDKDSGEVGLHTNFSLGKNGEFVGLYFKTGGGFTAIDTLTFGQQSSDISYGRITDGSQSFKHFGNATPGKSNQTSVALPNLLINEFMADNATTIVDPSDGGFDDWVELYNGMTFDLDLTNYYLTDDPANPTMWPFPDSLIESRGYKLVWADKDSGVGGMHTNFSLSKSGEFIGLYFDTGSDTVLVDARFFGSQTSDVSSGRNPDGGSSFVFYSPATPAATNTGRTIIIGARLSINELMADNAQTIADPSDGGFDDWIELYNDGFDPVNLAGYYMTDDAAEPTAWALPDSILGSGEFMLIWADNDGNVPGIHANFKLGKSGEFLGLFFDSGTDTVAIDTFTFGVQTPDTSYGRTPDGGVDLVYYATSTPGQSNNSGVIVSVEKLSDTSIETFTLEQNFPNPFNPETTLTYSLPTDADVSLIVFNMRGQKVATLVQEKQIQGSYRVNWNGHSDAGEVVSSGFYVYKLEAGAVSQTRKMLLLR